MVFSDNVGAEIASSEGTARAWDYARVVHCIWLHAATIRAQLWIVRVPSDDNISDLPSREEYELIEYLGAKFKRPELASPTWNVESWEALSLRRVLRVRVV